MAALDTLTSWLLTYALHSTLLLGAAWLLGSALGQRRLALQETVLRVALVGGLVTASLQVGAGLHPLGGVFRFAALSGAGLEEAASPTHATADVGTAGVSPQLPLAMPESSRSNQAVVAHSQDSNRRRGLMYAAVVVSWLVGALLASSRLFSSARSLRRLLRDRRLLPEGRRVRALAAALGLRRPVLLSACRRIVVPFATGLRRPQICLPERALSDLTPEQRDGLFAHELAHHARCDPAWIVVYRAIESAMFFQPLNRITRRRLQEIAECLSDDRAVRCTGNRVDLARCLVEVAQWAASAHHPIPGVAAVSARSGVGRRVDRLLTGDSEARVPRWLMTAAASVLLPVAVLMPAVSLSGAPTAEAAASMAEATLSDAVSEASPATDASPASEGATPAPRSDADPDAATASPSTAAPPESPTSPATPTPPEALSEQEIDRLRRQMEETAAKMAARAELTGAELERMQAELAAAAEAWTPTAEEVERLHAEVQRHAAEVRSLLEERSQATDEQRRLLDDHMRQMQQRLRDAAETLRPAEEELRRLREQARELSRRYRPTRDELRGLERSARDMASRSESRHRESDREAARAEAREAREEAYERSREEAREARELAAQAARAAREKLRQAREFQEQQRLEMQQRELDRARELEKKVEEELRKQQEQQEEQKKQEEARKQEKEQQR